MPQTAAFPLLGAHVLLHNIACKSLGYKLVEVTVFYNLVVKIFIRQDAVAHAVQLFFGFALIRSKCAVWLIQLKHGGCVRCLMHHGLFRQAGVLVDANPVAIFRSTPRRIGIVSSRHFHQLDIDTIDFNNSG